MSDKLRFVVVFLEKAIGRNFDKLKFVEPQMSAFIAAQQERRELTTGFITG